MDDRVDMVFLEQAVHRFHVAKVHLHEREPASDDLRHSFEACHVAVGHVVGYDYVVTCLYELYRNMAAYESGATRYQNSLFHHQILFVPSKLRING